MIAAVTAVRFRHVGGDRGAEWVAKGHRRRHFFAHSLFQLPKCAPDGYRVAQAMWGLSDLSAHWQLLLYADPVLLEGLPEELFYDDDLIWHQQHFGRPGQVATAAMVLDGRVLYSFVHHADLVQRIGRFRQHKTWVEKRFGGWPWMLLNGVLAFAIERGATVVRMPASGLAMRHTDTARTVLPYLFERVYDRPPAELPGGARHRGWWEIDVTAARAAVVQPTPAVEPERARERIVCVVHDLERGLGHVGYDDELVRRADRTAGRTLDAMLAAEARAGVRATYNVVGTLMGDVRDKLESGGHALAFHSFDHGAEAGQLQRCREVDYRLKGYRPPRSEITPELTDEHLAFHNFEWLALGEPVLGERSPRLRDRLVRVPITLDDFDLYTGAASYATWEAWLLFTVSTSSFTAVSLHDCYADLWLSHYHRLLASLTELARPMTLDAVSARAVIDAAA